jgi:broad specificity phosphatase PhoE
MILLVRHGRTAANARGLLLGRDDPALDDEGRRQSVRLAGELASLDVARVVTSPLARCRQTAEAIAGALAPTAETARGRSSGRGTVPVEVDERWIELDYGAFDGLASAEVPAATWAAWRADPAWAPEGGESLATLGERVRRACDELVSLARERDVVIVSHVSPIKAAVAWALGVDDAVAWRMWLTPASISRIGFTGSAPSLRSFNEVAHLS